MPSEKYNCAIALNMAYVITIVLASVAEIHLTGVASGQQDGISEKWNPVAEAWSDFISSR